MMAKLDAVSHCWVDSLANYNFQLYYRAGKTDIDADALSWCPGLAVCPMLWAPTTESLQQQCMSCRRHGVTAAAVYVMQEATLKGHMSPTEVYSCDLHVLDPVGDGPQVTCMTTSEWCQALRVDLVLGLVIARM